MMVSVKIDLGKRDFVWISLVVVLIGVGFVVAYNANMNVGTPSVMGHSAGELEINLSGQGMVNLQTAITSIQNNINNFVGGDSALGCITTDVSKGSVDVYGSIPLVLNGKNICEDMDGCMYMIMKIDTTDFQRPVQEIKKSNDQIYFQHSISGNWKDFGGSSQIGTNGDNIAKIFRTFDSHIDLMDDHISGETNQDEWTLRVGKDYGYNVVRVLVCDSSI